MEDMGGGTENDFSADRLGNEWSQGELSNSLELKGLLEQENAQLPKEDNPIETVKNLKNKPLLSLLISNQEQLSNRSITPETLPSHRTLQKGSFVQEMQNGAGDRLFFIAYLFEHFSNATDGERQAPLLYEQEYLLGGQARDQENLEAVCKKIMNIRTVSNYTYLLTDSAKQAEAEAMALTLCSLIPCPP